MSKAQSETFLGAVAAKNAEACDIDEWIEKWHSDQVELRGLPEFLGFTEIEYETWLTNPNALKEILENHSK